MKQKLERSEVYEACPHCGTPLSPWEKVLLAVDRAIMCRHCWYRMMLDVKKESQKPQEDKQ